MYKFSNFSRTFSQLPEILKHDFAVEMWTAGSRDHEEGHPKEKPSVMGVYEVERIVAKRVRGGQAEYFIQWQNYSPSENMWEPAEHLSEDLIALFENRSVDPLRADEYRERLALLFEKGLKSPTACHETVTMIHFIVL